MFRRSDDEFADMVRMRAKRPVVKADYEQTKPLDFQGRVKVSSKKNFQIESNAFIDSKVRIVLMHGKFGSNTFILDFGYPLCPIQAFGIALGA